MMSAIVNKQIEPLRSEQISFLNRINEPNNDQSKIITRKKSRQLKIEYYVVPVVVFIVTLIVIAIICIRQSNSSSKIITIKDVNDNEQNKETNPEMKKRQDFIRKMTQDAWNAYVKYGWTHDTIRPLTNQSLDQTFGPGMGLTIVSSMSTLWMMNLKEEFQMGRDWIENELNFNKLHREIDVQDAVNFYIGGLLSCYALTGSVDEMFVNKSRHIADRLDPVYRSPTGLPYWKIRPADGLASYSTPFLSAVGGQHLEYEYLYRITGNGTYRDRIQRIRSFLELMPKQSGLYMHQINVESGRWHSSTTTLSMVGRSFYNYLLRSFIQSNGEDFSAWNMFVDAIDAIEQTKMFINSSDTGLLYIRPYNLNLRYKRYPKYMNFESCSLGAMFALAANQLSNSSTLSSTSSLHLNDLTLKEKYWNLSLQLTRTCTEHANQTLSGFAPNRFYFDTDEFDDVNLNDSGRHVLFPELAETYFILWRLTKNSLYQDLAWKLAQRINLYCRTPNGGYTRIVDVNKMPVDQRPDQQDVVLLSSTLKYLYLTFTDNFPLERWVFNERAQPFPIFNL